MTMTDWSKDIADMHSKYGVNNWVYEKFTKDDLEKLTAFLEFRMSFLDEELAETKLAVKNKDPEEIVDGLIDLCVVAIGTLDAFGVNANTAWNCVHEANMAKTVGVKASRPNALGLPDLIKPDGWTAPSHLGNHGLLTGLFDKS
jgi:predicted HAD superfamily Cof-like phosphohydrolase